MAQVKASDFAKRFGEFRVQAEREPVAVTHHGRVSGYFLSPREFEEYRTLRARAASAYYAADLPAEALRAVAGAEMDSAHAGLDSLLED